MPSTARKRALEAALYRLYREEWPRLPIPPGKTRPYYAERFRQMIVPGCQNYIGGERAVKSVIHRPTSGFDRLKDYPHLTVEYLVLSGDWDDFFDDDDRRKAAKKLGRDRAQRAHF